MGILWTLIRGAHPNRIGPFKNVMEP